MLEQSATFGSALRRARLEAGMTLIQLADRVHYSKGQLSKVERGHKPPAPELARLCDAALEAGGRLNAVVTDKPRADVAASDSSGDQVATTSYGDAPPARRQVLTAGAASVFGTALPHHRPSTETAADGTLLDASRTLFDQFRRLGQTAPPGAVLPALGEQTRALRALAARSGSRTGNGLLILCARYAEFAGWMAQEAGQEQAALRWTEHAVELAQATGDSALASYALVRRGLISYYRGDASGTIALAQGVRSRRLPSRVLGLAAQREAQGHALAGDYNACRRKLDHARGLLAEDVANGSAPVLGTTNLSDPVSMITGWCLLDLGRPRQAARVFDQEMARIPAHALRTRARYGARQALAHALDGEIDHACDLTRDLLSAAHTVGSATIALDLRRLSHTLGRHPRNAAVKELAPLLAFALSPAAQPL
ncbi:helix-turn-helix domain-containing protein [Streptomyces niveus]|uniref:helix-turn-helix domain-containing protein n=1 Tax=Streptomyces niveus TaxID=193462 RepID=UPI0034193D76